MIIISSCSHSSLTGSNGKYAIRITNPVITIDSSGTVWISNADKTYKYLLSMARKDIENITECPESNGDSSTMYKVRRPYRKKKYMAIISYDSSSFPYTHTPINYENYSAYYTVELYQPYNIRSLYGDLISCKNIVPLRLAINEVFTLAKKNKLPEKIITRFDMNETPYFVRTNKDGNQIMIPYSLMVSYDDIGNMDDIVFPPVQLQDSLILTKKVDRMSFGYPVYMSDSVDMEKEYILELTRDEAKTYEYRGILKKRR